MTWILICMEILVELDVRDVDARTDHKISTVDFIKHCRSCSDGGACSRTALASIAHSV